MTQPPGTRAAVLETVQALLAITPDPLGRALPAKPVLGCRLAQAQPALHNRFAKNLSTVNRQTGMMVIVHLTSRENRLLDTISFSVLGQMDNNLLQLHS